MNTQRYFHNRDEQAQEQSTIIEPYRGPNGKRFALESALKAEPEIRVEFPTNIAEDSSIEPPPTLHWAEDTGINPDVVNWSLIGLGMLFLVLPALAVGELLSRVTQWITGEWISGILIIVLCLISLFMASRSLLNTRHSHMRWLSVSTSLLVIFVAAFILINFVPQLVSIQIRHIPGGSTVIGGVRR